MGSSQTTKALYSTVAMFKFLTPFACISALLALSSSALADRFNDRQEWYWGPSVQAGFSHLQTSVGGEGTKNGGFGGFALHGTHYSPQWSLGAELGFFSTLLLFQGGNRAANIAVSALSFSTN